MDKNRKLKVIISGGGTGGHVFPALAIADAIKQEHPNTEFLFVGAKGRIEMEKVPAAGYKIKGLNIAGFQRRLTIKNVTFPFKLFGSLVKSYAILKKFKPDVAVGVGGYASGPLLNVANWMNVPTLIQEQNSYPGITNRLLAGKANVICTAYENMERYFPNEKIKFTGNPVRSTISPNAGKHDEALKYFDLDKDRQTILVVGGSLGAKTINDTIRENLKDIAGMRHVQMIWQTGKIYYEECMNEGEEFNSIKIEKFIDRMDLAYEAADLIIARAGALTISELCLIGKPVVLIPSPNVAENHQMKNAMTLSDKNAAVVIADKDARELLLNEVFTLLVDEKRKEELSTNIKKMARTNAGEVIAKEVISLVE